MGLLDQGGRWRCLLYNYMTGRLAFGGCNLKLKEFPKGETPSTDGFPSFPASSFYFHWNHPSTTPND